MAITVSAALTGSIIVATPVPAHALSDTGTGGRFVPLQQRVFDSRSTTWGNAATPVKKSVWTQIPVAGANGVPSDAAAVQVTLTEVDASGNGVIYADKTGVDSPNTSMPYLTWYDTSVSNSAVLALGDDGGIQVSTNVTSMNLIVDVQGYYTSGNTSAGGYVPLNTDTRVWSSGSTKYATGASVDVPVGGLAGVPANASSAMINIVESGSTSGTDGYLVPYATGSSAPTYSSMNWTSGQNAVFTVPVKLGTGGKVTIKIKQGGSVALSVGIQGYFAATDGTAVLTPAHSRVYDSRSTAPVAQIAQNATRKIQIAGVAGVPTMGSGITAAAVNIYVLSGSQPGNVSAYADDAPAGDSSVVFYTNRITYDLTTVKLGADGGIVIKNLAAAPIDVLVDVEAWYVNPLAPTVSCPATYVPGTWTNQLPASAVTCTVTAPAASDSQTVLFTLIDNQPQDAIPVGAGGATTSLIVPNTAGWHEVDALLMNSEGDSLDASWSFGFNAAPPSAALKAVENADPTEFADVSTASANSGADMQESDGDVSGSIPTSTSGHVTVTTTGDDGSTASVQTGLPYASSAIAGTVEAPGVVSYDNGNGSSTLSVLHNDGTAQINTVVSSASGPSALNYPITLAPGETAQMGDNGSVTIVDAAGNTVGFLDTPWAVDATGQDVPTSYSVSGSTITQSLDLSAPGITYPVVADPSLWSVIGNSVGCATELATFVFVGAKVVKEFAEAEKIIKSAKKAIYWYKKLGGTVEKVIKLLKKYVQNRASLTSAQIIALENFFKFVGTVFFSAIGLGSCYQLATTKWSN